MGVPEAISAAMRETNERFCREVIEQGNLDALDAVYTEGARVLPPGAEMVEGREAIKGFWQAAVEHFAFTGATLSTVTAEMCGDSAVEIGRAELQMAGGETVQGKYLVHWKQENGQWRWDKDIWNLNA